MQAGDIERHLTQLGQELTDRGIQKPKTYILALKILAGREKDIEDSRLLLRYVKVRTRSQARLSAGPLRFACGPGRQC